MTDQKRRDGFAVATENREAALRWIIRFGGLTARQLAQLGWPGKPGGLQMAQRTLRALSDAKLVLERRVNNNLSLHVLSERGAAVLREKGPLHLNVQRMRDINIDKPAHRLIANNFAIDRLREGATVWTEFEILRRLAPIPQIIVNKQPKLPDVVVADEHSTSWVEVENAYKGPRRRREIMTVASQILAPGGGFTNLTFVSTSIPRLLDALRSAQDARTDNLLGSDTIWYIDMVVVRMSAQLVWEGIECSVSAGYFLDYLEKQSAFQQAVMQILGPFDGRLARLETRQLWNSFIDICQARNIPVEDLLDELGTTAQSYEDLRANLDIRKVNREAVAKHLTEVYLEWSNKEIGFNSQLFKQAANEVTRGIETR